MDNERKREKMFFTPQNPDTALKMYSSGYFITLAIVVTIVAFAIILSRKMNHKTVRKTIIGVGIFLWLSEFGKMIFYGTVYGIDVVEWIPLYYCSMEMYACILMLFKSKRLQNAACSFMFFGGIIGAVAFFCYPNSCIPDYPLFHYMTIRTFIFHGSMIYLGFLIVITKFYVPKVIHFKEYAIFLGITFIGAYIINTIKGTNLMYISHPLNMALSKLAFEALGVFYPFAFAILELIVPFFVSYGIYRLIMHIKTKNYKEGKVCLQ